MYSFPEDLVSKKLKKNQYKEYLILIVNRRESSQRLLQDKLIKKKLIKR